MLAIERLLGKIVGAAGGRETLNLCKVKSHLLTRFCMYNFETGPLKEDRYLKELMKIEDPTQSLHLQGQLPLV